MELMWQLGDRVTARDTSWTQSGRPNLVGLGVGAAVAQGDPARTGAARMAKRTSLTPVMLVVDSAGRMAWIPWKVVDGRG